MVTITLHSNDNVTPNTVNFTRENFAAIVEWMSEGARSTRINMDEKFAEIKHEVRNEFGSWVFRTVTIKG
jgi:hypothetical protein